MRLAQQLRGGAQILSAWSTIPDPMTVDAIAAAGFDAVTLEMQHGGHHEASVQSCIPAIVRNGKGAIVRIPVGRFDMASRALDMGAEAVIAPMINSLDDARRFAAAMKYPPVGERSWGASRAFSIHGMKGGNDYLLSANEKTLALAMIETREAYAIVDDILKVDGIDGVFVGPSDFSIAWTGGRMVDPALEETQKPIADIAARARNAGKLAAIYSVDGKPVPSYRDMGYQLITVGNEHAYIAMAAERILRP